MGPLFSQAIPARSHVTLVVTSGSQLHAFGMVWESLLASLSLSPPLPLPLPRPLPIPLPRLSLSLFVSLCLSLSLSHPERWSGLKYESQHTVVELNGNDKFVSRALRLCPIPLQTRKGYLNCSWHCVSEGCSPIRKTILRDACHALSAGCQITFEL